MNDHVKLAWLTLAASALFVGVVVIDVGWLRYLGASTGCAALTLLSGSMVRHWHTLTRRSRRISLWLYALLACAVYGLLEAASLNVELGLRVYIGAAVLLGLLVSVVWHPEGDTAPPARYHPHTQG